MNVSLLSRSHPLTQARTWRHVAGLAAVTLALTAGQARAELAHAPAAAAAASATTTAPGSVATAPQAAPTLPVSGSVDAASSPAAPDKRPPVDAALREKVLTQARSAGQLAAVMLKCAIRPNTLQAQALRDYRETVVALGMETGLTESEVDDVADEARDSTMGRLPSPMPRPLCEAARLRIAAVAQAYGLFQLQPPEYPGNPFEAPAPAEQGN